MSGARAGRPPWQQAPALVFVDDLAEPVLSDDDAHHLGRVLRIRTGAEICASDGSGAWRLCEFDGKASLSPTGQTFTEPRPRTELTVGVGLVKGQKPELVVQKLTEIGVDRIVLFEARRSIVRWNDEKAAKNIERLRSVVMSACGQSRRLFVPTVEFTSLDDLLGRGAVVADFDGRPLGPNDTTVLIGPEGGWEPGEYGQAEAIDLGPHVLRAETAAISAAVQMCALGRSGRQN